MDFRAASDACAGTPMKQRLLAILLAWHTLLFAGCATTTSTNIEGTTQQAASSIGPFPKFSGRLIVIEPNRRWQALIDWQAVNSRNGWLRLTHAASNTVIEFTWQGHSMRLRDNNHHDWRPISIEQLTTHGIIIQPARLAAILLGKMPADFQNRSPNHWQSNVAGTRIELQWQPESHRLTMIDSKHGRQATLVIQP